ncbi:MAG: immunoglobulin domain-containing protein [Verrucomicrobia bacterium]|nr:immunoglobulin domain-containing protein [Verrucomicrobiota bacterium]
MPLLSLLPILICGWVVSTARVSAQVFNFEGGPFGFGVTTFSGTVDRTIGIEDVDLILNLQTAGFGVIEDLEITLRSPAGTTVRLVASGVLGDLKGFLRGNRFLETGFSAEAPIPVEQASAPYTGSFKVDDASSTNSMVLFEGEQATGVWELKIRDAVGLGGTLFGGANAAAAPWTTEGTRLVITVVPPPSVPDLVSAADSGVSDTDDLTNVSSPTFSGTSKPNLPIVIYDGETVIGSTTADAAGQWTVTVSTPLTNGLHGIAAKARDANGNESHFSPILPITVDASAPTVSLIPDQRVAEDTEFLPVPFVIGDNQTDAPVLEVQIRGSNLELIPADRLTLTGSGAERSMLISPVAQANGQSTVAITVTDRAGNTAVRSFLADVVPVNDQPVMEPLGNVVLAEGSELRFAARTTDVDGDVLDYSIEGAPPGASIDRQSGVFVWRPDESQGPGVYTITVRATDPGGFNAARTFTVNVLEANQAPVLVPVGNVTASENVPVSFRIAAADPDLPSTGLTFSLGPNAPAGASIDPVTGEFQWVPDESQGPGIHPVRVIVSDGGPAPLTATADFSISVAEVNQPPVLAPVGRRSVLEGQSLSLVAEAVDHDVPVNQLAFRLGPGAPSGATIDSGTGQFLWTPGEQQGPGTYSVTVSVQDSGAGGLIASQTFEIVVGEANTPPVLGALVDQTVRNGDTLTVRLSATDPDFPANGLRFSLHSGAPAGAAVDPETGVFRWTPEPGSVGSTNTIAVLVTDSGVPPLSDSKTFTVVASPSNLAPRVGLIPEQSVNEGERLTVQVQATDADLPPQTLRYALSGREPAGALIDPVTGVISWTPTEGQGPLATQFSVLVSDNGTPSLSANQSFLVVVNEVNAAPTIAPVSEQTVQAGNPVSFAVLGSDGDLPANRLSYSLDAGAPDGAAINPVTGVFSWSPPVAALASTNVVTVRVTDDGSPALSGTREVTIVVTPSNRPPVLTAVTAQSVAEGSPIALSLSAVDPDLPLRYEMVSGPAGAALDPVSGAFSWTPDESQGPATHPVTVRVVDSGTSPLDAVGSFLIVVTEVNRAPVLSPLADQTLGVGDTLTLRAVASDSDLPANSLTFSLGAGAPAGAVIDPVSGVLTWTPAQGGTSNPITVVVADGGIPSLSDTQSFVAVVGAGPNQPPVLSTIADQTASEGTPTALIAFTVSDPDTPIGNLTLRAQSGDATLIPSGNIVFGGTGNTRTVRLTPAPNQSGTTTVTIEASEPAGGRTTVTFAVTVVLRAPEIVRQPVDQTVAGGAVLSVSVVASGSQPLSYQWSFNGGAIANATNSVLTVPSVTSENAGSYSVVISNRVGSVSSRLAQVTVQLVLRIAEQPRSQKVLVGGEARFRVVAGGAPPLTYEWNRDGVPVPGGTNPELVLSNVQSGQAGNYRLDVSDASGTIRSQPAVLEVLAPVVITQHPVAQTVAQGADVSFSVTAAGTPPIAYQWLYNGVPMPGANGRVLNLLAVGPNDAGAYTVVVSNGSGSGASQAALLTVSRPPVITRDPQSRTVLAGGNVLLKVVVSGTAPLVHQWQLNGVDIPGATEPNFSVQNISGAQAGEYRVRVENSAGLVTSQAATVAVIQAVTIASHPVTLTVIEGEPAVFEVTATGTAPLAFQWRRNGVDIEGATGATFRLGNARPDSAGAYQVVVSNASGPVASAVANLTVNSGVKILTQPTSRTVPNGSAVRFSVAATGTPPLSYQWQRDGVDLPGATAPGLDLANVQPDAAGLYRVVVRNVAGAVPSAEAALQVLAPPSIQTQPVGVTIALNGSSSFSVAASGGPPLTYQWQRNGGNIPGATNPTLTLGSVGLADAGSYTVVVQNPVGAVTSQPVPLGLNLPVLVTGNSAGNSPAPIEQVSGTFYGGSTSGTGAGIARRSASPGTGDRWFAWRAPQSGIATFSTVGSTFDTVLAIYTGTAPDLTKIASDDDGGGSLSSRVLFNAAQGTAYLVNVSGFAGATGEIVVGFNLEITAERVPTIVAAPAGRTVAVGNDASLAVEATGPGLRYQWFADGSQVVGATGPVLALTNIQESDARLYSVRVTAGTRSVETPPVSVQVGTLTDSAWDKFANAAGTALPGPQLQALSRSGTGLRQQGAAPATIVFSTYGSVKEPGEPNHSHLAGGASQWIRFVATQTGVVRFSTEGSDFDTLLAVYTGAGLSSLTLEGSDNNSGSDGRTSVLDLSVTAGRTYYIAVDGAGGVTGRARLSYQMGQPPEITLQPRSQSVPAGSAVPLFVITSGGADLKYQWYKDGAAIVGATSASLQFLSVQPGDAGRYEVDVSNFAGVVRSQVAQLDVTVPVTISVPPMNQEVAPGDRVRFAVIVSGADSIGYQWVRDGNPIAGADQAVYEIPSVQSTNAGLYSVTVRSGVQEIQSAAAVLTVTQAPVINRSPQALSVALGGEAGFTVDASGAGVLSYQWRLNGLDLPGATAASLVVPAVGGVHVGDYTVVVSNGVGSTESAPARLSVVVALSLAEQPQSQDVTAGSTAVFAVRASGTGTFGYQWRRQGNDIPGATGAFHVVAGATTADAGSYSVLVSRGAESIASEPAVLTVRTLPVITLQPSNEVVIAGSDVSLRVVASGAGPLSYQWRKDGNPIDGAIEAILVLTGLGAGDAGGYSVVVSNPAGSVESQLAVLGVQDPVSDVRFGTTGFSFRLNAPAGRSARVQFTTDFNTWTDLLPAPVSGPVDVTDPDGLTTALRFYRIVIE